MAKPTIIPEFASSDLTDPTSGENNVAEPTTNAKTYGWVPMLTAPFRQWMNWLHRYYYLWIKFINDELVPAVTNNTADIAMNGTSIGLNSADIATNVSDIATINGYFTSGTASAKITTSYVTIEQTFDIDWIKVSGLLLLKLQGATSGISNSNNLLLYPVTSWPSVFVSSPTQIIPCIIYDNGNDQLGAIKLPNSISSYFQLFIADPADNRTKSTSFTTSGNKGIPRQTIAVIA